MFALFLIIIIMLIIVRELVYGFYEKEGNKRKEYIK